MPARRSSGRCNPRLSRTGPPPMAPSPGGGQCGSDEQQAGAQSARAMTPIERQACGAASSIDRGQQFIQPVWQPHVSLPLLRSLTARQSIGAPVSEQGRLHAGDCHGPPCGRSRQELAGCKRQPNRFLPTPLPRRARVPYRRDAHMHWRRHTIPMDEPTLMDGVTVSWRCSECASILLGEPGTPQGLRLAERDPCTGRLFDIPRRGTIYCVCEECCTEWLYEGALAAIEQTAFAQPALA